MDPPTSYITYPVLDQDADSFTQVPHETLSGGADETSPRFVPNYPSWYSVPPDFIKADIEPSTKRRKIQSPPLSASVSSPSQGSAYSQDIPQLASRISILTCPVHGQNSWCFQQWAIEQLTMEAHIQPLSKRMAELGRLVCSCAAIGPPEPDGYERLIDDQPYYDPTQQYVAEKSSLALATDVRKFPTCFTWETDAGRYSDQNVIRPHEFNGQQPFEAEPIMNFSSPPQDGYAFNPELAGATIPITAFTVIARAPAPAEFAEARWTGPRPGKRGPFRDPTLRKDTAYTRKIGSCIRCRMQRIRCDRNPEDPDGVCLTCKKIALPKTGQLPCLRYKIVDISLYKSGQVPGFEWTQRWSNEITDPIDTWASSEVRTIYVSEGYSDHAVELQVRQFVPIAGDKLERTWSYEGEKKAVSIPPFALIDMDKARKAFAQHVDNSIVDTLKKKAAPEMRMIYATYLAAHRLAQQKDLDSELANILQSTFRLWTSARLNTISNFIVGDDTLGMPTNILDETSPDPGRVPVPPVMGAQLNLVMIHQIQARLRKTVLDQLQKMVQKNKQSYWLVTYYVNFMLLHNASMIIEHDAGYAIKHGINRRFAREDKVQEYHMGANVILAYFHYCNKGLYPFSTQCIVSELRGLAELSDKGIAYVSTMKKYAQSREPEWRRLRESTEYDHPEYYVSQMFEQNWRPRTMVI